jgi:hypothetical protein
MRQWCASSSPQIKSLSSSARRQPSEEPSHLRQETPPLVGRTHNSP